MELSLWHIGLAKLYRDGFYWLIEPRRKVYLNNLPRVTSKNYILISLRVPVEAVVRYFP